MSKETTLLHKQKESKRKIFFFLHKKVSPIFERGGRFYVFVLALSAFVLAWEMHSFFSQKKEGKHSLSVSQVLVAKRNIPAGIPINRISFSLREAETSETKTKKWVTDQDLWKMEEWVTKMEMQEGAPLEWANLRWEAKKPLSFKIPKGKRAYVFPAVIDLGAMVGDRIEFRFLPEGVHSIAAEGVRERMTEIAELIAIEGAGNWVLAVYPNQIPLLEEARKSGTLSVSLLNAEEGREQESLSRKGSFLNQKKRGKRHATNPSIQILE